MPLSKTVSAEHDPRRYELYTWLPLVGQSKSEFRITHRDTRLFPGFPVLPHCENRRGTGAAAANALADLAGLCIPGCSFAFGAAQTLAHTPRSRTRRICR